MDQVTQNVSRGAAFWPTWANSPSCWQGRMTRFAPRVIRTPRNSMRRLVVLSKPPHHPELWEEERLEREQLSRLVTAMGKLNLNPEALPETLEHDALRDIIPYWDVADSNQHEQMLEHYNRIHDGQD